MPPLPRKCHTLFCCCNQLLNWKAFAEVVHSRQNHKNKSVNMDVNPDNIIFK